MDQTSSIVLEVDVPHLLKIYFGLGWTSSVLEIVSVMKIKNKLIEQNG